MLSKEQTGLIAKLLRLTPEALTAAIAAEAETAIEIPEGLTALTADELSSRDKTVKTASYKEGSTAALEMFVKEQKTALGLTFDGKDTTALMDAYKTKVMADANLAPSDALKAKDAIIDGLRANLTQAQQAATDAANAAKATQRKAAIQAAMPKNLVSTIEPTEVLLSMEARGYSFEEDEAGQVVVKKGGQLQADAALRPLPIADVLTGYATERGWIDTGAGGRAGRGAGSSGAAGAGATGKPTSLSAAQKQWETEGKNIGTADFSRYVDTLAAENKEFDMELGK